MKSRIPVEDAARIPEVRRLAQTIASQQRMTEGLCSDVGIVASEIASNVLKHGEKGEVQVYRCLEPGVTGVDIVSIDRGPGMSNAAACLQDGFSSAGTSGAGLGAIARLSLEFDLYSQAGKGTVVFARIGQRANEPSGTSIGGVCVPIFGEDVSGDAWAVRQEGPVCWLIVSDGLGHGVLAHSASKDAVAAFLHSEPDAPASVLERVNRALRGSRGAAVAVARLSPVQREVRYSGIGNIFGVLLSDTKPHAMTSQNGTGGHGSKRIQEFGYPLPEYWNMVMHSDGLTTSWRDLSAYPGLARRHPGVIAATLLRDHSRGRDDACVVVAQKRSLP